MSAPNVDDPLAADIAEVRFDHSWRRLSGSQSSDSTLASPLLLATLHPTSLQHTPAGMENESSEGACDSPRVDRQIRQEGVGCLLHYCETSVTTSSWNTAALVNVAMQHVVTGNLATLSARVRIRR